MAVLSVLMPKRRSVTWLLALVANALFNYELAFRLIGAINARLRLIGCVFLVYPSRRALVPQRRSVQLILDRFRWRPAIGGIFRQGKLWGVTFAVASSEPELIEARNAGRLQSLAGQMERIRELLHAERCALAGVLPSILHSRGVPGRTDEAEVAAECVRRAIDEVRRLEGLEKSPVLLLGCRGFVGSRVHALLPDQRVYAIDRMEDMRAEFPEELKGERAILVNLTWANVLETYLDQMWAGLVVLNEVYPPPSPASVRTMSDRGVSVYHLAGVEGFAFPPFPDAYSGGVPCCATRIEEDLRVRVVRLGTACGIQCIHGGNHGTEDRRRGTQAAR